MNRIARTTTGVLAAVAGSAALAFAAAPGASAAPVSVCPALPGQSSSAADCTAASGPTGLSLAITLDGGMAAVAGNNFSGPAAVAIGNGAQVNMDGVRPGLSIGIAGPGGQVTVDGVNRVTCTDGPGFAGDFQTLTGCFNDGTTQVPLG